MNTSIVLVDDHVLLRKGLADHLKELGYTVVFEANHGADFINKIETSSIPDLVLMDINMPVMNGYDTTLWLQKNHPQVKVLALSMYEEETSIIRMLRNGAKGYILKDCEPAELKAALNAIQTKGYYQSELVTGKMIHAINNWDNLKQLEVLSDREIEFLKWACTELTYKEIADKMRLSPRTIDGYRDALFEKLGIKSRVGLVLYALKKGIVHI